MPITVDQIRSRIQAVFPDAEVSVTDTTGSGDHFAATVVTAAFEGKGLIERHREVYSALGEAMHGPIHALSLVTCTPFEPHHLSPPHATHP
jgi:stress-induced morphogen